MGTNGSTMLEPLRQGLPPLDPAAVSNAASCALPARYEAVREARAVHPAEHSPSGTSTTASTTSALVVSELVTNALRHALPDGRRGCADAGPGAARTAAPDALDRAAGVRGARPQPGQPGARRAESSERTSRPESGRGLFLVDSFSDSWGWHPLAGRAERQGRLGAVPAARRAGRRGRLDGPRRLLATPGFDARSRPAVHVHGLRCPDAAAGQLAIRWSNSPSLTPRSIASISARRVDERRSVGEARVAHGHLAAGQPGELHAGALRVAVPALLPRQLKQGSEFCSCHPVVRVVHRKPPIVQMSTPPDHSCVHERCMGRCTCTRGGPLITDRLALAPGGACVGRPRGRRRRPPCRPPSPRGRSRRAAGSSWSGGTSPPRGR